MKWFPIGAACVWGGCRLVRIRRGAHNPAIAYLIEHNGYRMAFIVFGAIQGLVVLVAAQFLRMPPEAWLPAGWEAIKARVQRKVQQSSRDYTPGEMMRSGSFYLLYLM